MKALRLCIIGFFLTVTFIGCSRYSIEPPEGFAEVKRQGLNNFLAVSPEGIKLSVRTVKNYPKQTIEYWQTALGDHMEKAGYSFISGPVSFETKKQEGVFFEWGAPYEGKDFVYLTGLIVSGKKLLILEAGGEYDIYREYKPKMLESIQAMSVR